MSEESDKCILPIKRLSCTFINKKRRIKPRKKCQSSSSSEDEIKIVKKDKKFVHNPLVQKTFGVTDREKNEESDSDDAAVKTYRANRTDLNPRGPKDQGATAYQQMHTDKSQDAQTLFEIAKKNNEDMKTCNDKNYKGQNNYYQYIEKKDTSRGNASSGYNRLGPMRAPEHLRATVRWDYQPDICKDYKETGFCSFGDSCKFLHDRTDYKYGWQIEQEIAEGTYGQDADDNRYEIRDQSDEDESIPLECMICRKDFVEPVITRCKHYFCSACALKKFRKTPRCYACSEDTKGVFKNVPELLGKIAKIKSKRVSISSAESGSENENSCSRPGMSNLIENAAEINNPLTDSSSEEIEGIDDNDDLGIKGGPMPTISRMAGAQPEALQDCNTSEEESD